MFYNFLKKIKRQAFNHSIFFISIILIIALGIFTRTKLLILNPSFWYDTCALGVNIDKSYVNLLKPLDIAQVSPVIFLWISKFFYSIFFDGTDLAQKDFILRLFPYITGCLSLFVFPILVHKMFKNCYVTMVSAIMLAFNSKAIYYSIEFKQYSLELFIAIILIYIFYDFDIKTISERKFWIYSLILAFSIWCSNSSVFIIPVGILMLIYSAYKNNQLKKVLKFFIPFFISFSFFISCFYFPVYFAMYEDMKNHWLNADPSFFTIGNFVEKFSDKISSLIQLPFNINVYLFIIINIAIMIYLKNYRVLFLTIFPLIIMILFSFFNMYPFQTRLILFILPMLIVLYSQVILLIKQNRIISILVILLITGFSFYKVIQPVEQYIINISSARELFVSIKEDNPELKNIISTENSVLLKYYGRTESIIDEVSWVNFANDSKIPEFLQHAENGKYYVYSPFNMWNYCIDLKNYLKNNDKIKLIKITEGTDNTFSAVIEKIK